jgi:4'-phosphopantetheinyl transferase EntD
MSLDMPLYERRGERLRALAAEVFDPSIAIAATRIDGFDGTELIGTEADAMVHASQRRRAEFTAGRVAGRRSMALEEGIPMGPDRAPVWPDGIRGSITHAGDWALAATSRSVRMIGVDLEPAEPLPEDVMDTILWDTEKEWIDRSTDPGLMARVVFSAKECAYKAQYPITRRLFGFGVFRITIQENRFFAEFQQDIGCFGRGEVLEGRFSIGGGFILTGIAL